MLQYLKQKAIAAHYGTSFSPEKRGEQMIKDYSELLLSDLEEIKEATSEAKDLYKSRFIKFFSAYLSAKGRCMSTMIAGPSKFPVRQQEKYQNWEQSAYNKFEEFRQKAIKGINRQIQNDKPESEKQDEAWQTIEKSILRSADTIIKIDKGIERGYSRALFVNSITGLIKRMAANGQTTHVQKAIELVKEINSKNIKPIITLKNSIFSLIAVAEVVKEAQTVTANRESKEFKFPGFAVIYNFQADRLQVKHEVKPLQDVISLLKKNGFKFSPSQIVWQRFLNNNSIYTTQQLFNIKLPAFIA